ncbi:hypothetical protein QA584_26395 [Anaerocolumna sp. AGMB13025]|uniref:hypothetical protein n=1 Tax=Anaerocolumna sp. AGMB13025 TaxID=3039116 RepID=UPI00241E54C7|nr:hypothetical protein [Anaerocolumna sp. AGMB13025]WFR57102.1 hypothetical protein QA584_26395 [Anaerocolumna sp. AGMB13025]
MDKIKWDTNMFNVVKKFMDELNPMGLLPHAPEHEYDIEFKKIASQIIKTVL